jgi:hypothetical protein
MIVEIKNIGIWKETVLATSNYRLNIRLHKSSIGMRNSSEQIQTKDLSLQKSVQHNMMLCDSSVLATAACRRSDCQLVRIEGATWSA